MRRSFNAGRQGVARMVATAMGTGDAAALMDLRELHA
jgi:hypothetical protein